MLSLRLLVALRVTTNQKHGQEDKLEVNIKDSFGVSFLGKDAELVNNNLIASHDLKYSVLSVRAYTPMRSAPVAFAYNCACNWSRPNSKGRRRCLFIDADDESAANHDLWTRHHAGVSTLDE